MDKTIILMLEKKNKSLEDDILEHKKLIGHPCLCDPCGSGEEYCNDNCFNQEKIKALEVEAADWEWKYKDTMKHLKSTQEAHDKCEDDLDAKIKELQARIKKLEVEASKEPKLTMHPGYCRCDKCKLLKINGYRVWR